VSNIDELLHHNGYTLKLWITDSDNLPAPEVIAAEIVEDLEAALEQFREILADMDGVLVDVSGS